MKSKFLLAALLACPSLMMGQTAADPTIMTVNGQPVQRSEFEYS